jgi:hypothetical protein
MYTHRRLLPDKWTLHLTIYRSAGRDVGSLVSSLGLIHIWKSCVLRARSVRMRKGDLRMSASYTWWPWFLVLDGTSGSQIVVSGS